MTDVTKIDAFFQSSPHPAWLATSRGECLYVNPALERLIGLKSDQINHVDWCSFVLEEDRVAASASWQRSLTSGTPYRATVRLRGFDNGVPASVELKSLSDTHSMTGQNSGYLPVLTCMVLLNNTRGLKHNCKRL